MSHDHDITTPEDIKLFLKLVCSNEARGLLRPVKMPTLAVKYKFSSSAVNSVSDPIKLVGISAIGLKKLKDFGAIRVEVYGQDKRVFFQSEITQVTDGMLLIKFPTKVKQTERRGRIRYLTNEDHLPFFDPGGWVVEPSDIAAPPYFGLYRPLATMNMVLDISLGGVCVETRFPSIVRWLEGINDFPNSSIQMPMKNPVSVATQLRWTKRIRERVALENGEETSIQKYNFGLEFIKPSRDFLMIVTEFLKVMKITASRSQD